ncbi:hypothetical protein AMTRI_Chr06g174910 [Amborella trichopoda]
MGLLCPIPLSWTGLLYFYYSLSTVETTDFPLQVVFTLLLNIFLSHILQLNPFSLHNQKSLLLPSVPAHIYTLNLLFLKIILILLQHSKSFSLLPSPIQSLCLHTCLQSL